MDLSSYLLKPIQRMSKYALLLKDMVKECTKAQEQKLSDLRTAEEMVKFQLRHGNDPLATDAIQGRDVSFSPLLLCFSLDLPAVVYLQNSMSPRETERSALTPMIYPPLELVRLSYGTKSWSARCCTP